jgi:hypothetical protein
MKNLQSQRGSVILYAMLAMAVMLAIGLTLNALFISKLRSASQARDSIVALYAADSATELCLYESRTLTSEPSPRLQFTALQGVAFDIINMANQQDISADCSVLSSGSFTFRATGTYRGARRTLEITQ